jgi:hypothetical protein
MFFYHNYSTILDPNLRQLALTMVTNECSQETAAEDLAEDLASSTGLIGFFFF